MITYKIYDSENPDDVDSLRISNKAGSMHSALWDLLNYRRELYKGYKPFKIDKVLQELADIIEYSKVDEE